MLRISAKIGLSNISGIGLFSDQFIPKGTTTWQYDSKFDTSFDEADLAEMPDVARGPFLKYSYFDHDLGKYILCSDYQRFINHSASPNIASTPTRDIAMRDIDEGEELTCDYTMYEHDWFDRHGLKKEDFR